MKKILCIVLSIMFACLPFAYADQAKNLRDKINQVKVLLDQIQNDFSQTIQNNVYLGTAQVDASYPSETLNTYTNQLINILNDYQNPAKFSQNVIPDLQWLQATNLTLPKNTLVNVGLANTKVNICRASFVGANFQSKAIYPGQLTAAGCRISYAGYAFIVTKFDVLAGPEKGLQWIPIADVKSKMQAAPKQRVIKSVTPISISSTLFPVNSLLSFNYNININDAVPLAGGYEGGNPVLICRVHQNNSATLGKLVLFMGSDGSLQDVCDISVNEKEVTVPNHYELLFWKAK